MPGPLVELFAQYARGAGAQVAVAADAQAAASIIAGGPAGRVCCTAEVRDRYPALYRALTQAGGPVAVAEEIAAQEPDRAALAVALAGETGVLRARAGVAETGSVVLADNGLAPRLLSMLADVCVVLLPATAILPDLDAAAALLEQLDQAGCRYVSLVTGPSRTADIERVLTIGVQGPKTLQIIIVTQEDR
ncbi:MAG TPA: LUD domain-containing protein [Chloroflexia bacterium]|nr:LUD domain-containing protein [Chloroflexia bacterium]